MVRGVNRTIIEINCTENKYFNKVLLFVDPDCTASEQQLDKKAKEYVSSLKAEKKVDIQNIKDFSGGLSFRAKLLLLSLSATVFLTVACLMIFGII